MKKYSILICDLVNPYGFNELENEAIIHYKNEITMDELCNIIHFYDVIVLRSRIVLDKKILLLANNLKIIARAGSGLDNIDTNTANKLNIKIISIPDASANSVAELVLGFMICLSRNIICNDEKIRNKGWLPNIGNEIRSKTIGIIGFGRIGKIVAKMSMDLGMNVIIYARSKYDEKRYNITNDLYYLLANSDFVTLHVPLTLNTKNMISIKELSYMKKTAFLINTARGPIIHEPSLVQALKNNTIGGAALDVFDKESQINPDLLNLENIIITPHIGAQTIEVQEFISKQIASKISQIMKNHES